MIWENAFLIKWKFLVKLFVRCVFVMGIQHMHVRLLVEGVLLNFLACCIETYALKQPLLVNLFE